LDFWGRKNFIFNQFNEFNKFFFPGITIQIK
jgi:hypothetical protein